jgi:ubiquinone/menaquinone biosynthesis C-methylase UbiE
MEWSRKSTVDWERDVYAQGKQMNRWPYSEVVSAVLSGTAGDDRSAMRILEIGCGTGNNLWFALDAGFQTSGMDMSATAIDYARKRLDGMGYHDVDLHVGDIVTLPWEDEQFDIVLDRGTLTQSTYDNIRRALSEVRRVLKPNGKFFSFSLVGKSSSERKYGTEVSPNTYDHFTGGQLTTVGLTSFFAEEDIRSLFSEFREIKVTRCRYESLGEDYMDEEYSVSCIK